MIKLNKSTSKVFLILFGTLDFITVIKNYHRIYRLTFSNHEFNWINMLYLLVYGSFLLSGYFLVKQKKFGIWMSYFQFPLRLALMIFSFGFLMIINRIFDFQQIGILILSGFLTVMEVSRLIITIWIQRNYYKQR